MGLVLGLNFALASRAGVVGWSPSKLEDALVADINPAMYTYTDHLHDEGEHENHATLLITGSASQDYSLRYINNDGPTPLGLNKCIDFLQSHDSGILLNDLHPYEVSPVGLDLSVSVWVKVPDLSTQRVILTYGTGSSQGIYVSTAGKYRITDHAGSTSVESTSAITANQWTHLVITRSAAGAVKLYKNGVQDATVGSGFTTDQTWKYIGNYPTSYSQNIGRMADLRVYKSVITQDDVTALYGGGEATVTPEWHYLLDNGIDDEPFAGDRVHRLIATEDGTAVFTQDTVALRPIYRSVVADEWEDTLDHDLVGWPLINGRQALEFTGTEILRLASAALATCDEVYAVVKVRSVANAYQTILSSADEGATNTYLELFARGNTANPHPGCAFSQGGSGYVLDGSTTIVDERPMLVSFRTNAGAIVISVDGVDETLNADSGTNNGNFFDDLTGEDNVTIGAKQTSGGVSNGFVGHIYRIVCTSGMSADERTQLRSYLTDRYLTSYDLTMDGDSIVTGTLDVGESYPISWADMLPTLRAYGSKPTNYYNTAEGGTNFTAMSTDPRKAITLQFIDDANDAGRLPVYIFQMGNGLLELQPTAYYTALKAYIAELRAQGDCAVFTCHIFHRDNDDAAPGWNTGEAVNEFNTFLSSDPSIFDGLLDWINDTSYTSTPHYGSLAAASDPTLFFDGIHQTDIVNEYAAAYANAALGRRLSNGWSTCSVAPVITGITKYPETLTCSTGTWSQDGTKSYQWYRSGEIGTIWEGHASKIEGATSSTYTLTADDVLHTIKCNVGNTVGGVTAWTASDYTSEISSYFGSSLIANGRFDNSYGAGWDDLPNGVLTLAGDALVLTQTTPATNHAAIFASPDLTVEEGEWYEYRVDFTEGTGGDGRAFIQNGDTDEILAQVEFPSTGTYRAVFQSTGTSLHVEAVRDPGNAGDGKIWTVDNITVQKLVDSQWKQFIDHDYSSTNFATNSNTTFTADFEAGPINETGWTFQADKLVMLVNSYWYWGDSGASRWAFVSGPGDAIRYLVAVKGESGKKVALRSANGGGSASSILHTFNGSWQIIELEVTLGDPLAGGPGLGFDRRNGVVAGSEDGGTVTFSVWGIAYFMP